MAQDSLPAFASGYQGGTYNQVAVAINEGAGNKWQVKPTGGTSDNANLVASGQAQLGLGQVDVIMHAISIPQKTRDQLKVLFPVFTEEVHILARKSIKNVSDLQKKRVAVGPKGSGSAVTARLLLIAYYIKFHVKMLNMPNETALAQLQAGQIDAIIMVGGAPISKLKDISAPGLHLLSMQGDRYNYLTSEGFPYTKKIIPTGTYPFQKTRVNTIAVPSVVFAHQGYSSDLLKSLLKDLIDQKESLVAKHGKFNEFNKAFIEKLYPLFKDKADKNLKEILADL